MHEAIAVFICVLAAAMVVVLTVLYLRHRNLQMFHQERMAALEKGTAIPLGPSLAPWSPRVYLLRGLVWSFAGAALIVCLLGIAASSHRPQPVEGILWRAKGIAEAANISLEEAKQIVEKDNATRTSGAPLSVALLGLIPLGVGLAYLVFYYTGGLRNAGDVLPDVREKA
jgi:hypothetical protein